MNLELAKSRRLAALEKRNSDRVLVAPAFRESELHLPNEGSVADLIVNALSKGMATEQFATEAGWSLSRTMVNLFKVAKKTGVGIERRDGKLFAVWPNGHEGGDGFLHEPFKSHKRSDSGCIHVA